MHIGGHSFRCPLDIDSIEIANHGATHQIDHCHNEAARALHVFYSIIHKFCHRNTVGEIRPLHDGGLSQQEEEEQQQTALAAAEALEADAKRWKTALDPNTKRTYYYDAVTRVTQWEKPASVRALDKLKRAKKKRQRQAFFRIMEENILRSIERGEVIPGVVDKETAVALRTQGLPTIQKGSTTKAAATATAAAAEGGQQLQQQQQQQPVQQQLQPAAGGVSLSTAKVPASAEATGCVTNGNSSIDPSNGLGQYSLAATMTTTTATATITKIGDNHSTGLSSPPAAEIPTARVRTISRMNEQLLLELHQQHNQQQQQQQQQPSHPQHSNNSAAAPAANTMLTGLPRSYGGGDDLTASASPGGGDVGSATKGHRPPLYNPAMKRVPRATENGYGGNGSDNEDNDDSMLSNMVLSPSSLHGECLLLDGPAEEEDGELEPAAQINSSFLVVPSLAPSRPGPTEAAPSSSVSNTGTNTLNTTTILSPLPSTASNIRTQQQHHVRSNTGGIIDTMDSTTLFNPNIKATIFSVAGVYRAHIVQAAQNQNRRSPPSVLDVHANDVNLDVFRDDFDDRSSKSKKKRNKNKGAIAKQKYQQTETGAEIPSLANIVQFYQEFYQRSQMEHDTILMSLIYVERLIKETHGSLTPTAENWRSVLLSCMILASKVWDDLSMWNIDFSHVSAASKSTSSNAAKTNAKSTEHDPSSSNSNVIPSFSLQRINQLELAVLNCLNFNVKVAASEYAKYYFLIRTMLKRSGLLVDGSTDARTSRPLNQDQAVQFERRTSHYQDSKVYNNDNTDSIVRRSRSVDETWFGQHSHSIATAAENVDDVQGMGPVLKDKVCLEQLESMSSNRGDS